MHGTPNVPPRFKLVITVQGAPTPPRSPGYILKFAKQITQGNQAYQIVLQQPYHNVVSHTYNM